MTDDSHIPEPNHSRDPQREHAETPPTPPRRRRRLRRRWLLLSSIPLAAAGLFAARAFAHGGHGCRHGGVTSEADMREHMLDRLDFLLDRVDASDSQHAEVEKIVTRRAPALFAQRERGRALRGEIVAALRAGDRDRLQTLRGRGVKLFDEATALGLETVQEVGDVLDAEQRQRVLSKLDRFMADHHH